ncbi:MAG: metallophosphoesterase [archaeon]
MDIIQSLLERGILVSPDVMDDSSLVRVLPGLTEEQLACASIIDKDFLVSVGLLSKGDTGTAGPNFKVIFSYEKKPKKLSVLDFTSYFNRRFEKLSSFLRQRLEFQRTMSINRLKGKTEKEQVAIIGLVFEKSVTKNNNIIITLEDPTGSINVMIKPDKKELYAFAKDIVLDELIGIEGTLSNNFVFVNQIFIPDVPDTKEFKMGPTDDCVAVLGDPHFGSKAFLKGEFEDFIEWINQRKGNEDQKALAAKVKYLVMAGDLVEGIGIYPGQEEDLTINNIQEQYDVFANYIRSIPNHIRIFISPGNHDAGRISEPQPPIQHKYAESLRSIPNVTLVSNPAIVNIGATSEFPGFDFLIYHGYSLTYYADHVDSIRSKGGQKRSDLIMRFLLQRRHLAPTHTSNLYMPDSEEDPMVISKLPDFFITGHIHRVSVSNYKNITLINGSCWDSMTEYEEKRGLLPQPAKVPVINLKTREVKIINFLKDDKDSQGKLLPRMEAVGKQKDGKGVKE